MGRTGTRKGIGLRRGELGKDAGSRVEAGDEDEGEAFLDKDEARKYRRLAAMANYTGQDTRELQFAAMR